MAKLIVFAAHDAKLKSFMAPFFLQHVGQALRMWEELCNDGKSLPAKFPSDFVLYQLGEFDDAEGRFSMLEVPHRLSSGLEAKHESQPDLGLKRAQANA